MDPVLGRGIEILCILALIGIDSKISFARWKRLGMSIELNPVVRAAGAANRPIFALWTHLASNLVILAATLPFPVLTHILLGAKLALGAMQLRSLQLESSTATIQRQRFNALGPSRRQDSRPDIRSRQSP